MDHHAFGAGLFKIAGFLFAIAFAILITVGQVIVYARGMRPAIDYAAFRRPRLTRHQFWGTVVRTIGYIATALICSSFIHHVDHPWSFALRLGFVTGIVTGSGIMVNPYIEYCQSPPGTPAGSVWDRPHSVRIRSPVSAVLAGSV